MSAQIDRAMLLLEQNRPQMAARELQGHLTEKPDDGYAHALLSLCLVDAEDYDGASNASHAAIKLAPDSPFSHYALARTLLARNYQRDALAAVKEAIRLDPDYSPAFTLLAQIHLDQKEHGAALAAADRGLEIDPEDVTCRNLRALALKNLGRHAEAAEAIGNALEKDPENSLTHATQGWALLERNEPERALHHFQESLRIDPTNDSAREGIVYALKARYKVYAVFLRYFLWMSKLSQNAQWGVIIGVWFGSRILGSMARTNPEWAPYILPIRMLLFAFAIMTWVADPLFNLALRLNKYGRLALTRDQIMASNFVGLLIAGAIGSLVMGYAVGPRGPWHLIALGTAVMIIPVTALFNCERGWPRQMMTLYTVVLGAMGLVALLFLLGVIDEKTSPLSGLAAISGIMFFFGIFVSGWVANYLMMQRVRK